MNAVVLVVVATSDSNFSAVAPRLWASYKDLFSLSRPGRLCACSLRRQRSEKSRRSGRIDGQSAERKLTQRDLFFRDALSTSTNKSSGRRPRTTISGATSAGAFPAPEAASLRGTRRGRGSIGRYFIQERGFGCVPPSFSPLSSHLEPALSTHPSTKKKKLQSPLPLQGLTRPASRRRPGPDARRRRRVLLRPAEEARGVTEEGGGRTKRRRRKENEQAFLLFCFFSLFRRLLPFVQKSENWNSFIS